MQAAQKAAYLRDANDAPTSRRFASKLTCGNLIQIEERYQCTDEGKREQESDNVAKGYGGRRNHRSIPRGSQLSRRMVAFG
jgi:hypothetical protein